MSVTTRPDLVVAGIPYLRSGREELRERARRALDRGDEDLALAELLTDRDDWAPGEPPSLDDARRAIAAPTLREAMEHLRYGAVADYFAYRLSDPTYLSGLALLRAWPGQPVFELGCGIGLLLREAGQDAVGADVVFSKLWLARRFVVPDARLVCFDASDPFPFADGEFATALCHDALYFLPDKAHVVAELARVAPTVLIGHTHNREVDTHGDPLTVDEYAQLLPGATLYDDAELTAAYLEQRAPRPSDDLSDAAAIALVEASGPAQAASEKMGTVPFLSRNPLLRADGRVAWPSARYRDEYAPLSGHLTAEGDPVHLRQVLDLPEAWGVRPAPLGFGVVGCGWVARDFVLPALEQTPWARAIAGVDPNGVPDGLEARADLDALLADPEVEAVYVATPNDLHADAVRAAADAGKAILCEKPMAHALADAEAMAEAVKRAGVPYATAFDQRHHPAHVRLRALVADGRLGTVTAVRIVYCCWVGPDWAADNWRADPARAGGGALLDLAPHGLDLAQHLLGGDELAELTAMRQRKVHSYAVEDGAMLTGRTHGDVLVQAHVAYNHPEDRPRRRLEVVGTDGLAVATDTMGQAPGGTLTVDGVPQPFAGTSPFTAQLQWFARAVLDETPLTPDADLRLMRLLEPWR